MALLGATGLGGLALASLDAAFRAAQWASILEGALVAVLAWRLAADVALERSMPAGRARTLALGTGLTVGVYLPLVLHSALPDSTMPFAALVLAVCLLAGRVARDARAGVDAGAGGSGNSVADGRSVAPAAQVAAPASAQAAPASAQVAAPATWRDRRVLAIGVLLGLAALTRNEAIWLALGWVVVARGMAGTRERWFRLVAAAAVPAMIVYAPWAIRDWLTFGSPLPGQAVTNALSLSGRDIFAWEVTPTIARYLDAGLPTLVGLRWTGFVHNLVSVLLLPGMPIAAIGLVALPWTARGTALRLLVVFSAITFVATTLLFPVSTTWGTFLHAAAAVQVLLVVSALLGLDGLLAAIGRRRGWTRHVAWLGAVLGIAGGALFTAAVLPSFGRDGDSVRAQYAALPDALRAADAYPAIPRQPLGGSLAPAVITDFPIYLAETTGFNAIALPDESPISVLDLAHAFPGTNLVIVSADNDGLWPEIAATDPVGMRCFEPVPLATGDESGAPPSALANVRVFRIICP